MAIGSTRTMALFGTDAAGVGAKSSAIIEFHVADVDARFDALRGMLDEVVQVPTTNPGAIAPCWSETPTATS